MPLPQIEPDAPAARRQGIVLPEKQRGLPGNPEDRKPDYLRRQARRRSENEYPACDTASVSSCSGLIRQAKYGQNREGSRLPVFFGKPSGNIPEVKTIANLMQDIDFRETGDLNLLLDRAFRGEKNRNGLMQRHHQFLTGVRTSLKPVGGRLNEDRNDCITGGNYNSGPRLDVRSYAESRDYTGESPAGVRPWRTSAGSASIFISMISTARMTGSRIMRACTGNTS